MLRTLKERGVKITVLASEGTNTDIIRALSRIADVKLKNDMFGGGVIGDSRQVMILLGEGRIEKGSMNRLQFGQIILDLLVLQKIISTTYGKTQVPRKKTDINASSKMKVDEPNTVIIISSLTDVFKKD